MPTVSVIVPVYNVEPYIHRCIDSILNQTFTDLELILVDDGSKDNCLEICYKYAALDSRVKVISKNHIGVSAARNSGLYFMQGKYCCFCDADDELPKDAILSMIEAKKISNADLVIGGFTYYNIKTDVLQPYSKKRTSLVIDEIGLKNNAELLWWQNNMLTSCAKLYNSDIIRTNNIRFNENLTVLEDFDFVLSYLNHVKVIHSIKKDAYYQIVEENSEFHRKTMDYVDTVNDVYNKFIGYLQSKSIPICDTITYEIDSQVIFVLKMLSSVVPKNLFDLITRKKRSKKILTYDCVKQSLSNLSLNTYYQSIINKYGIINWLSGIAIELKEIEDDYLMIKNEKGNLFSLLWKLKKHMEIYL